MSNKTTLARAGLHEVTLLKAHTHAGRSYAADTKIKVNTADRQWLTDHKIIAATDQKE